MPCAPVGGWMWAASPATNTRPTEYRSTMRWLIRNTDDHRRLRRGRGLGCEPVDDGLDVLQGRRAARPETVLDPVAAAGGAVRQIGSARASTSGNGRRPCSGIARARRPSRPPSCARADPQPRRHRPVDLDVAEHVLLGERPALEAEAEGLADHAVRAVGSRPGMRLGRSPRRPRRDRGASRRRRPARSRPARTSRSIWCRARPAVPARIRSVSYCGIR